MRTSLWTHEDPWIEPPCPGCFSSWNMTRARPDLSMAASRELATLTKNEVRRALVRVLPALPLLAVAIARFSFVGSLPPVVSFVVIALTCGFAMDGVRTYRHPRRQRQIARSETDAATCWLRVQHTGLIWIAEVWVVRALDNQLGRFLSSDRSEGPKPPDARRADVIVRLADSSRLCAYDSWGTVWGQPHDGETVFLEIAGEQFWTARPAYGAVFHRLMEAGHLYGFTPS